MAAASSNHVEEGNRNLEVERLAEPTPSFTAVNGNTSPAPQSKSKPDPEVRKEGTEATNHRQLLPNNHTEKAKSPAPDGPSSRQEVSHRERRLSPAPPSASASASTAAASSAAAPTKPTQTTEQTYFQHSETPNGPTTQYGKGHVVTPSGEKPPNATMSSQKRKRSTSQEQENSSNPMHPNNGPPHSPGGQRMHSIDTGHPRDREAYSPRQTYPPPHEAYGPPAHEVYSTPSQHTYPPPPGPNGPPEIYPRPERHQLVRNDYDQPVDPSIAPAQPRPYYSEGHYSDSNLAEALQRENRSYDSIPSRENYVTPEDDDDQQGQYGDYSGNRGSQSGMDMDRKRRKRVFSNRTKTGCMTCRRRKKKCDEQHPECNNCLRGGFVCEGYTMRNTWQKPSNAKQPIPLQSKNGYPPQQVTPGRAPFQPGHSRYHEVSPEYPGPPAQSVHNRRQSYEGDRVKPINIEDDRDQVYGRSSPPNANAKPGSAWAKASRPYPSNPPHASKYQEGENRGSMYDSPLEGQDPNTMHPPPSVHRTGSAQSQYSIAPHPPNSNNTPPNHNTVQAAAQAALTHPASLRPSPSRRNNEQFTEREKMLKGLYYYPLTPALTEDRERCIAAIWRFNNATNPSHGASPEERIRLFRQILNLRPSPEPPLSNGEAPPTNFPLPFGSVGERVVVEAPFHCDYGYNITVGDDVLIGADCRISDTCSVTIGARCIFSPNVKLVCATYPIDPRRRMGSNGPALGRNIVIEEDCWIGANVTILAGVRVGKSSTVGAGSLLHQDVPRFTVVAGNPAKVSRGIYDGNAEGN